MKVSIWMEKLFFIVMMKPMRLTGIGRWLLISQAQSGQMKMKGESIYVSCGKSEAKINLIKLV